MLPEDLERDFMEYVTAKGLEVSEQDLRSWQTSLEEIPGGSLSLESLRAEYQLNREAKFEILAYAVTEYMKQVSGITLSGTARDLAPYNALSLGCQKFPDCGAEIVSATGELARFMDFDQAARRHFPRRGNLGINYSYDTKIWREEVSGSDLIRDSRLKSLQGRIRGGAEVNVFSTLASWVDEQECAGPELAEKVRDGLGLPHLEGREVLELRLSEYTVRCYGFLRKPTFADSGGYPPFLPSQRHDPYGFARDLNSENLHSQGGPEIWHGDLPAREISGLRRLGKPANDLRIDFWRTYNEWWSNHF